MAFLHASYSGYFPFCITEVTQAGEHPYGPNTAHPVGMQLADVMALFWKAKKFRLVEGWNTVWDGFFPIPPPYIVTNVGTTDELIDTGRFTMTESLCPPFHTILETSSGLFKRTYPSGAEVFATDILTLQLFLDEPYVIYTEGLYWPYLVFSRASRDSNEYWQWVSIGGGGLYEEFYQAGFFINGNTYSFPMYGIIGGTLSKNCTSVFTIEEERNAE